MNSTFDKDYCVYKKQILFPYRIHVETVVLMQKVKRVKCCDISFLNV